MAWIGVITNAGAALLAAWSLGGETLTIDGVTVGSGTTAEVNMRAATALANEKDDGSIVSAKAVEGGTEFKAQIGPASAEVGAYTAHEIGLWGHLGSGSRTLIALHQDSADGVPVPLASVSPAFVFALYMVHAISNDGTLSVTIDGSAFVSQSTLDDAVSEIREDMEDLAPKDDVVTLSEQSLTTAQQDQVCENLGIDRSTMRQVPFTIAVSDWSGSSPSFTANFLTEYVTNNSVELVVFDSSLGEYAQAHIDSVKKTGGGGITFTTAVKPTGPISGNILVWANNDGKLPVLIEGTVTPIANGGTGQSSLSGAKQALGITALSEQIANVPSIVNLSTSLTIDHADSATIGYRTTEATKVDIRTLSGFPTGKTIVCAYPHGYDDIYGRVLWVDNSLYLRGVSKDSATVSVTITVFYK